jgi:D-alanyl-lipoteichoic acid acyltransferase DltB (MBOAT superfamily)
MLFNSYVFLLAFLPLTLLLFHGLRRLGRPRAAILALTLMSLVFYGSWKAVYLLLLLPLMACDLAIAPHLLPRQGRHAPAARPLLTLGIALNLGALGWFKYANFFVDNVNDLLGLDLFLARIVLPIGISFFTFQKVAFLVDAYRGRVERIDPLDYALFVSFFPQLVAGPIVHHSEVMPQFRRGGAASFANFALGLSIFGIGLAKKVLLADTAALYASPAFDAAAAGAPLDLLAAWCAALAYTAQLYFDFSGYSDMAIGGALLFGIRLPVNFASPYKSASIIEFWRRWHMTLSRFLRDYLYVPLGGNRKGRARRYLNLFLTMLLGGFWHGAGWTFVIWGALHGVYLMINHGWRALRGGAPPRPPLRAAGRLAGQAVTFLAVVVAWVFFRAADLDTALSILASMAGAHGVAAPASLAGLWPALPASTAPLDAGAGLLVAGLLLALTWLAPSTQELTAYEAPRGLQAERVFEAPRRGLRWRPAPGWAVAVGALFGVCLMSMSRVSEFIYFQF